MITKRTALLAAMAATVGEIGGFERVEAQDASGAGMMIDANPNAGTGTISPVVFAQRLAGVVNIITGVVFAMFGIAAIIRRRRP